MIFIERLLYDLPAGRADLQSSVHAYAKRVFRRRQVSMRVSAVQALSARVCRPHAFARRNTPPKKEMLHDHGDRGSARFRRSCWTTVPPYEVEPPASRACPRSIFICAAFHLGWWRNVDRKLFAVPRKRQTGNKTEQAFSARREAVEDSEPDEDLDDPLMCHPAPARALAR